MNDFIKDFTKRLKNELKGGIKDRICYIHTHKCGGTSISSAIREHYIGLDMRTDQELISLDAESSAIASNYRENSEKELYQFREMLLTYFLGLKKTRFVSGHFIFNENVYKRFKKNYSFIIVLRNPIERWISHYFFNRYKKKKFGKIDIDLQECLASDFGLENGREYIKFLGGFFENKIQNREAIEKAKSNLEFFDVIGFLEYKIDFIQKFNSRFGVKLSLTKKNENPKSEAFKKSLLTEEIKEKIAEVCIPDIALYNYAVENYLKIFK